MSKLSSIFNKSIFYQALKDQTSSSEEIFSESMQNVCNELGSICLKLQKLLPDPSLGPMERIERLARIVPHSLQLGVNHRTARSKLLEIRNRLDELVPENDMNYLEKIDYLVDLINKLVPEKTDRICQKLQFIGDHRCRDNGSIPYSGWSIYKLNLEQSVDEKRKQGIDPNSYDYIKEEDLEKLL